MQYERGAGDGKDSFPILGEMTVKNIERAWASTGWR